MLRYYHKAGHQPGMANTPETGSLPTAPAGLLSACHLLSWLPHSRTLKSWTGHISKHRCLRSRCLTEYKWSQCINRQKKKTLWIRFVSFFSASGEKNGGENDVQCENSHKPESDRFEEANSLHPSCWPRAPAQQVLGKQHSLVSS